VSPADGSIIINAICHVTLSRIASIVVTATERMQLQTVTQGTNIQDILALQTHQRS
jgi:hypothetical protein